MTAEDDLGPAAGEAADDEDRSRRGLPASGAAPGGGAGGGGSGGRFAVGLSGGWLVPACSVALGVGAAVPLVRGAGDYRSLTLRLAAVAVGVLIGGLALRSERLVAVATGPMVGAVLASVAGRDEVVWVPALVAGALWFAAVEVAMADAGFPPGAQVAAAVIHRRVQEVATVVAAGAATSLVGVAVAVLAPDRSIMVRLIVLGAVLAALGAVVGHLTSTAPGEPEPDPDL